jgi:secreted PhoX family phosphatase
VYFTTKGDDHVRSVDTTTDQLEVVYDGTGLLTGVDNITAEVGSGDLYVAEDGGDMQLVVITADGDVAPIVQVVGEELPPEGVDSEITGPAFSPDGTRLYFSSQRGGNPQTGITYEITGPFRGVDQEPAATTTVAAASTTVADAGSAASADEDSDDSSSPALPIGIAVGAAAVVVGGVVAVRRRREA